MNKHEIHVFGLSRSGIYAITHWILGHFKGPCELRIKAQYNAHPNKREWFNASKEQIALMERGEFNDRDCLLLTHENRDLLSFRDDWYEMSHSRRGQYGNPRWLGDPENVTVVLIVRDPYNHFASWLKGKKDWTLKKLAAYWVQYAQEALGETSYLPHGTVVVNYNRWFTNKAYRRDISARLGLEFSDQNLQAVPWKFGGSSFDKQTFDGRAQEMAVLDRWREYENDEQFLKAVRQPRIAYLAGKLFPSLEVIL